MGGGVTRFPHVLHAHRLLHHAEREAGWRVQHDLAGKAVGPHALLAGRVFAAFYADDVFLGTENLARIAAAAGLDEARVLAYLRSTEDEAEVRRTARKYSEQIGG
eukprot:gene8899-34771_t